jgi:NDP-sugar pyrophosphorylase family protein
MRLQYHEDPMPRGPAGCLYDAATASDAETFVVVEGSVLADFDLQLLLETHQRENAVLTIATKGGRDVQGGQSEVPAGVYAVSRSALDVIPPSGYQDLKEVLVPRLYREGANVVVHEIPAGSARRIVDVRSYLAANMAAVTRLSERRGTRPDFERSGQSWIHRSAKVASTACLKGPLLVDRDVQIAANAVVVGPAVVGASTRIGCGSVLSRSVVWRSCQIADGVIVDQALVTDGVQVRDVDVVRQTVLVADRSGGRSRFLKRCSDRSARRYA